MPRLTDYELAKRGLEDGTVDWNDLNWELRHQLDPERCGKETSAKYRRFLTEICNPDKHPNRVLRHAVQEAVERGAW